MKKSIIAFSVLLLAITMSGCKTAQATFSKDTITATAWQVYSVMGKTVTATDYAKGLPDATFAQDDRVSGNGGCNRYSGSYKIGDNGSLAFGPMLSTKMFCPGGGEEEFMKAMGQVTSVKIDGKNLVLANGDKNLVVFTPKTK